MDPQFEFCLNEILLWEGGFSDHPKDPGGATKWGITIKTLIHKGLDINNDGTINRKDILDLPKEEMKLIYFEDYWLPSGCMRLPLELLPIKLLHFDCAVNQGVGRAVRFIQKVSGAKVDGIFGNKTRAHVMYRYEKNPYKFLQKYAVERASHYSSLAIVAVFGRGWFNRLFDIYTKAHDKI